MLLLSDLGIIYSAGKKKEKKLGSDFPVPGHKCDST